MVAYALLGIGSFFKGFVEGQRRRVEIQRWALMNEYYKMIMAKAGWDMEIGKFKGGYGDQGTVAFGKDYDGYHSRLFDGGQGKVTPSEVYGALLNAGMPAGDAEKLTAIVDRESGYKLTIDNHGMNKDGSTDWGLFQVNDKAWPQLNPATAVNGADVQTQANAAYQIWKQQGLGAWGGAGGKVENALNGVSQEAINAAHEAAVSYRGTQETGAPKPTPIATPKPTPVAAPAKDAEGRPVQTDDQGRALGPDGKPVPNAPVQSSQAQQPFKPYQVAGPWEPPPAQSQTNTLSSITGDTGAPPPPGTKPDISIPQVIPRLAGPAPIEPYGGRPTTPMPSPREGDAPITPYDQRGVPPAPIEPYDRRGVPPAPIDPFDRRGVPQSTSSQGGGYPVVATGMPKETDKPTKDVTPTKGKGEPEKEKGKEAPKDLTSESQRGYAMAQPGQRAVGSALSPQNYDPYWRPNPPTAERKAIQIKAAARPPSQIAVPPKQVAQPTGMPPDQFAQGRGPEYAAATAPHPAVATPAPAPVAGGGGGGGGGRGGMSSEEMQSNLAMLERMNAMGGGGSDEGGGSNMAMNLPSDQGGGTTQVGIPQVVDFSAQPSPNPYAGMAYGRDQYEGPDFSVMASRKGGPVRYAKGGDVTKFQGGGGAIASYIPGNYTYNVDMGMANAWNQAGGALGQEYAGQRGGTYDVNAVAAQENADLNMQSYFLNAASAAAQPPAATPKSTPTPTPTPTPAPPPNITTTSTATDPYLQSIANQTTTTQARLTNDLNAQNTAAVNAAVQANTPSTAPRTVPTVPSSFTPTATKSPTTTGMPSATTGMGGATAGDMATTSPLLRSYAGFDDGGDVGPAALGPPPALGSAMASSGQQIPPYYYNFYTYPPSGAPVGKGITTGSVGTVMPSAPVPTYQEGGEVQDASMTSPGYDPVIQGGGYGYSGGYGQPDNSFVDRLRVSGRGALPSLRTMQGGSGRGFMGFDIPDPPEYGPNGEYMKPQGAPPWASAISDHQGNPSMDIVHAIQGGMQSLMQTFGLQPPTQQQGIPNPQEQAYQQRNQQAFQNVRSGLTHEDLHHLGEIVDPMHQLDDNLRYLAGLGGMYKYYMFHGQPEIAQRVAAGMLLYARELHQEYGAQAEKALNEGDSQMAMELNAMGYSAVPNGITYDVKNQPNSDGTHTVGAFNLANKQLWEEHVLPEKMIELAMGAKYGVAFWRTLQGMAGKYDPDERMQLVEEMKNKQNLEAERQFEASQTGMPQPTPVQQRGNAGQDWHLPEMTTPIQAAAPPTPQQAPFQVVNAPPAVQQFNRPSAVGAPVSPNAQGQASPQPEPPTSDSQLAAGIGAGQTGLPPAPGPTREAAADLPAPGVHPVQALTSEQEMQGAGNIMQHWQNSIYDQSGNLISGGMSWPSPVSDAQAVQGITDPKARHDAITANRAYATEYAKARSFAETQAKANADAQLADWKAGVQEQRAKEGERFKTQQTEAAANRQMGRDIFKGQQEEEGRRQTELLKEKLLKDRPLSSEALQKEIDPQGVGVNGNYYIARAAGFPGNWQDANSVNQFLQQKGFTPEEQDQIGDALLMARQYSPDIPLDTLARSLYGVMSGWRMDAPNPEDTPLGKMYTPTITYPNGHTVTFKIPAEFGHNLRMLAEFKGAGQRVAASAQQPSRFRGEQYEAPDVTGGIRPRLGGAPPPTSAVTPPSIRKSLEETFPPMQTGLPPSRHMPIRGLGGAPVQ